MGDGKSHRPIADEHDVVGALHYAPCDERWILDSADGSDSARAPRGAVHHLRVELDLTLFVRQAAKANRVIIGIVLDLVDDC